MKKSFFLALLVFCLFLLAFSVSFASRGIVAVPIKDKAGNQVGLYKESHALVIGVSGYTEGWSILPGALRDVRLVKEALEENGFHVVTVENPTRREMLEAFDDFINRYGNEPDARLLFYFAGHGHTLKMATGLEMGYIVPADTPNPHRDEPGFRAKAIDMQMMEVYAKRIQAKHAIFLFDSCFSGSIFALSRTAPENISFKTSRPVRQFITAGSADETVPDESIFRGQFIAALMGEGDSDGDGYVTGVELGEFLQRKVINYSHGTQHPQYGKIRNPVLDKGDFVFPLAKAEPFEPVLDTVIQERMKLEQERQRLEAENKRLAKNRLVEEKRRLELARKRLEEERIKHREQTVSLPPGTEVSENTETWYQKAARNGLGDVDEDKLRKDGLWAYQKIKEMLEGNKIIQPQ